MAFDEAQYNNAKLNRYKDIITWEGEYVAPIELRGAWIDVTYEQYKGMIFNIKKDNDNPVPKSATKKIMKELDEMFTALLIDRGWSSPFVIQIDKHGWCHLLLCMRESGKPKSLDMILRRFTKTVVKKGQEAEE